MDVWEIWLAGLVGIRILLMVPITAETAASLLRHLDKAGSAVVVVNLGPKVWMIDAALLASRHRRAKEG